MMERKIYKYPLLREPEQEIVLPHDFEPLKVERMGEGLFMWGIVGPKTEPRLRRLSIIGTGWEHDFYGQQYLGTVFDLDGLVWHVFIDKVH